jgi:hypothetical protein
MLVQALIYKLSMRSSLLEIQQAAQYLGVNDVPAAIVAGWAAWTMILASAFVYVAFFMATTEAASLPRLKSN